MRPRSIRVFALAYGAMVALNFTSALLDLDTQRDWLAIYLPDIDWDRPAVLVAITVRAAIGLLPMWMIYARAARFGLWAATVFFVLRLQGTPDALRGIAAGGGPAALWIAGTVAGALAIALLFRPESRYWFATKGRTIER